MRIDILTLFPEVFDEYINSSIIKRARENNLLEVNLINFRDYAFNKHNQVDDTPYGGGAGMLLMIEPIVKALEDIKTDDSLTILLTPSGKTYNQKMAYKLSKNYKHIILICGHYEGVDARIKHFIDLEISIGDYILTGGELGALVMLDSITRLIPGVIREDSLDYESFNDNLLDYPDYTKPRDFRGYKVPDVLLSGDHEKIRKYREEERLRVTKEKRKDLLDK